VPTRHGPSEILDEKGQTGLLGNLANRGLGLRLARVDTSSRYDPPAEIRKSGIGVLEQQGGVVLVDKENPYR
jgi:hypothetical protein